MGGGEDGLAKRSLPSWSARAWVRSITHRRLAWIGAGSPQVAISPTSPRLANTFRQGWWS
jgi:hypothetical protein